MSLSLDSPPPPPPPPLPPPSSSSYPDNHHHHRPQWSNQLEFYLSCISMSVGLGNVWRFPVTLYRCGGLAFIFPYLLVLLFIGWPIYFLELSLGQFTSRNQVGVWSAVPLFQGVGFGTMIAAMCLLSYYCSILALPAYYFVRSFEDPLPWTLCDRDRDRDPEHSATNKSCPEYFFRSVVLKEAEDINSGIGSPDKALSLCLLFSWTIIYLSILKGVRSSGKVAYLTALFPLAGLLLLFIRALSLPHASLGISHFMRPKWEKLWDPRVYYEAVSMQLFSLGTGLGSIIMMSSYNPFHTNVYRASLIMTGLDTGVSFLAGVVSFAILGYLAHELGMEETGEVVGQLGEGDLQLAFVSYPHAISKLPWGSREISILFFTTLFSLGLGSATATASAISTIFCDKYEDFREWVVTFGICAVGCAIGLVYVTPVGWVAYQREHKVRLAVVLQGGQFILHLVDFFGGGFLIYLLSTLEVVGIAWFYGLGNFFEDIEYMLGIRLGLFWRLCWGLIIPLVVPTVFVYSIVTERLGYNGESYPTSATVCGWLLSCIVLACLVGGALLAIKRVNERSWIKRTRLALKPEWDWGPRMRDIRDGWLVAKSKKMEKEYEYEETDF